jgi:hypothetical protein
VALLSRFSRDREPCNEFDISQSGSPLQGIALGSVINGGNLKKQRTA